MRSADVDELHRASQYTTVINVPLTSTRQPLAQFKRSSRKLEGLLVKHLPLICAPVLGTG